MAMDTTYIHKKNIYRGTYYWKLMLATCGMGPVGVGVGYWLHVDGVVSGMLM